MTGATLWIEITIAGAVYVAAAFCAVCAVLRLPVAIPHAFADDSAYAGAAFVAASYICGVVVHRNLQNVYQVVRTIGASLGLRSESPIRASDDAVFDRALMRTWLHGNERLHREIDFQFALLALFGSLLGSVPLLAISLFSWLWRNGLTGAWLVPALGSILWVLVATAYWRQDRSYRAKQEAAFAVIDDKLALDAARDPEAV